MIWAEAWALLSDGYVDFTAEEAWTCLGPSFSADSTACCVDCAHQGKLRDFFPGGYDEDSKTETDS